MKCVRLEVYVHVGDLVDMDDWNLFEEIGPEVISWTVEEMPDCPTILEGSCPSCGRWLDPVSDDLQPACGDCSRVTT